MSKKVKRRKKVDLNSFKVILNPVYETEKEHIARLRHLAKLIFPTFSNRENAKDSESSSK